MTQASKCCKFLGQTRWPRRALLCLAPESTCRMSRKASRNPKICPKPRSFIAAGTSRIVLVLVVTNRVSAAERANGSCTTWAICLPVGRAISTSFTLNIAVPTAVNQGFIVVNYIIDENLQCFLKMIVL